MVKEKQIYYLLAPKSNMVKIGSSHNIPARIQTLQADGPENFILLATEPGTLKHEYSAHKRFAKYRRKGEWFECSDEIKEYINSIKDIDWDFKISDQDIDILRLIGNGAKSGKDINKHADSAGVNFAKTIEKLKLLLLINPLMKDNGEIFEDGDGYCIYVLTETGIYEVGEHSFNCPHCHKQIN